MWLLYLVGLRNKKTPRIICIPYTIIFLIFCIRITYLTDQQPVVVQWWQDPEGQAYVQDPLLRWAHFLQVVLWWVLPSHIPVANRLAKAGYSPVFKKQSRTTFKPTLPPFQREICRAVITHGRKRFLYSRTSIIPLFVRLNVSRVKRFP